MILEIKNLSKLYQRGYREFEAVKSLNYSIDKGTLDIVIGKSGSGKSTFLNMIAGLISPDNGEIVLDGENIWDLSDKKRSLIRNKKIGFLPQGISAIGNLTVTENILLPYYMYEKKEKDINEVARYMKMLEIYNLKDEYPRNLSGGELRRVLIVRALVNDPDFIMADEPTSDLDIENTEKVMNLFSVLRDEGKSILMVSHDLDVLSYADNIYTMKSGVLEEGRCVL